MTRECLEGLIDNKEILTEDTLHIMDIVLKECPIKDEVYLIKFSKYFTNYGPKEIHMVKKSLANLSKLGIIKKSANSHRLKMLV